jgi:hypothetical protein
MIEADLLVLIVLLVAVGWLVSRLLDASARNRLGRRLDRAQWRRTEYVDEAGATHVVLRRSARDRDGHEVLADHDRRVAVIPAEAPDFDDRLARARLEADLSADRTNYRRQ